MGGDYTRETRHAAAWMNSEILTSFSCFDKLSGVSVVWVNDTLAQENKDFFSDRSIVSPKRVSGKNDDYYLYPLPQNNTIFCCLLRNVFLLM